MPNHYDIDIYCKKCGKYMCTVYPDDFYPNRVYICDECELEMNKKKIKK